MVKGNFLLSYLLLASCMFGNCSSKLSYDDYRLFNNTPVEKLAEFVKNEETDSISAFIRNHKDVINFQDTLYGNTLLMMTVYNRQEKSMECLLKNGVDVNKREFSNGSTALMVACWLQYEEGVKLLLKFGAKVNDLQTEGKEGNMPNRSPLMIAAESGNRNIMEILLNANADINLVNRYKDSALTYACHQGNYTVAFFLIKRGADIHRPVFYRFDDYGDLTIPVYLNDFLNESDPYSTPKSELKVKEEIKQWIKNRGTDKR